MIGGVEHLAAQLLAGTGERRHLLVHQRRHAADVLRTLPDRFHGALQVVLHPGHLAAQVLELSGDGQAEDGDHEADDGEGEGNDGERDRHGRPDPGRRVLHLKQHD